MDGETREVCKYVGNCMRWGVREVAWAVHLMVSPLPHFFGGRAMLIDSLFALSCR